MIDIRGIVKLLGKSKLKLIFISDSSTCLYSYLVIYSKSPTTPYYHPSVSLTLLYYSLLLPSDSTDYYRVLGSSYREFYIIIVIILNLVLE